MKYLKINFTILVCLTSSLAFSQISYGIKVGLNASKVTTDYLPYANSIKEETYKPGLNIGGFLDYYLTEDLSLSSELIYNQMGWKYKFETPVTPGFTVSGNGSVRYHYISIPILAKYHFEDFTIGGGFQPSYLVKYHDSIYTPSSGLSRFDSGIILDGNYKIMDKITLGVRYYRGIAKKFSNSPYAPERRNSAFSLNLMFQIN